MPGERVVWIPPERLCTGTKGWKRSSVTLEIRATSDRRVSCNIGSQGEEV
ncbi:hypothetical protein EYF80_046204 [Liparis tanakae]|uniref:Uncharacterized protein n=1 Tax=Liparis tanakae TaxID=230148 RepID=A0A4Z2FRK2_9TELE|nr:hypothetical protein EYF80_046204 [Liparis tanakae]